MMVSAFRTIGVNLIFILSLTLEKEIAFIDIKGPVKHFKVAQFDLS